VVGPRADGVNWLELPPDTGFGIDNLPLGIFSAGDAGPRSGVRIGDVVLDLWAWSHDEDHVTGSLNAFLARGPERWAALRQDVRNCLTDEAYRGAVEPYLLPIDDVTMHLPIEVADYVDFYSSKHHAENIGRIFRPDAEPLTPNWTHLPIGYHGRAGTVRVSGTPVVRPSGQRKGPADDVPTFGPSQRLDIEAEVGFVIGTPSALGEPVPVAAFADHVFGVCLVNDWSARDLQAWEYVPLGPFLGKSFLTSVSPWVVPLAALEAARISPPSRESTVLPYLDDAAHPWGLDLTLEVRLNGAVVSCPPFASMAALRTGDLFASGTVSGPDRDQRGSLIELSWNGAEPLALADGTTRTFLEDGDVVTISASATGPAGTRIGFGEVTGRVLPAR
jgi:fumarylacetoacetase